MRRKFLWLIICGVLFLNACGKMSDMQDSFESSCAEDGTEKEKEESRLFEGFILDYKIIDEKRTPFLYNDDMQLIFRGDYIELTRYGSNEVFEIALPNCSCDDTFALGRMSSVWGDVNGDGVEDLVFTEWFTGTSRLQMVDVVDGQTMEVVSFDYSVEDLARFLPEFEVIEDMVSKDGVRETVKVQYDMHEKTYAYTIDMSHIETDSLDIMVDQDAQDYRYYSEGGTIVVETGFGFARPGNVIIDVVGILRGELVYQEETGNMILDADSVCIEWVEGKESTEEIEVLVPDFTSESGNISKDTEIVYSSFQKELTDGEMSYDLEFEWAVIDGQLLLRVAENFPETYTLDTIAGDSDKVLLMVGEKQGYIHKIYVCDLLKNTITGLVEEEIVEYNVYDVEVSTDLQHVILNTDETDYYYNGKGLISLATLCGQENAERLSGVMVEDKVLITAYGADGTEATSFYVYIPGEGSASLTVQLETKAGLKRYGDAYATASVDGVLMIYNLMTGDKHATAISSDEINNILTIDEKTFLVITTENKLYRVDKESANVSSVSEKIIDFSNAKSWGISTDAEGIHYLCVQGEDNIFSFYRVK